VRAEKLDAIEDVTSVGIEITRNRDSAAQSSNRVVHVFGESSGR
jgi:hypothetical protein